MLKAVSGQPPCTADDVADEVRVEIGASSRQAVYDALRILTEEGTIRHIQPGGSPAHYENREADNHHHLMCCAFGETVDVGVAVGDASRYRTGETEVIHWGTCPECLRATLDSAGC